MRLGELVATSRRVAATSARSEKVATVAALLRALEPAEIEVAVACLSGRLRQGRVGVGWAALEKAREDGFARGPEGPTLFDVVSDARSSSPATAGATPLTLTEVDRAFERIGASSGPGSTTERTRLLAELFRRATPEEADFLVRLIAGELRQGALAGVMEESLARATEIPVGEIRRAVMLAGDLNPVARAALTEGGAGLARFRLQLFRPLKPMLAQTAEDLDDALGRLGEAVLEYKLDGARVQVHKALGEVRVYSRLGNEVTAAVPELIPLVRSLPARAAIFDGEVIALRRDGTPEPFQVTMRRFGRKLEVERIQRELPLTPFLFDVLHLDGQDLFEKPARERLEALDRAAPGLAVRRLVTRVPSAALAFFDEALASGHEGVMAKSQEAPYQAGGRGFGWLKVKPAHTLDLVVLAAEWGHGRRSGWLSNLHLGARDPETGGFAMIGKTFKGMTDEMLTWQTAKLHDLALVIDGATVYVRPELVVEVAFNDVQESPRYVSGLALRFARVKRYREDKHAAEADTVATLRAILAGERRKARKP